MSVGGRTAEATAAVVGVIIIAAIVTAHLTMPEPTVQPALEGHLRPIVEMQINLVMELSRQLVNWGFILAGAQAFFLKLLAESKLLLRKPDLLLIEAAMVLALISVLYGFLLVREIVGLLQIDQFNVAAEAIRAPAERQYYAIVGSMVLTVIFAHQYFWRTR